MRRLAHLVEELSRGSQEGRVLRLLEAYFAEAEAEEAAWAVHLLRGGRVRRVATQAVLESWAREAWPGSGWLWKLSSEHVGDVAEVIALLFEPVEDAVSVGCELGEVLAMWDALSRGGEELASAWLCEVWASGLEASVCYLLNRLAMGGLRTLVDGAVLERALARHAGVEAAAIAWRMREFEASAAGWARLVLADTRDVEGRLPLAWEPLVAWEGEASFDQVLGTSLEEWWAEWLPEGVRVQVGRPVEGGVEVWTEAGELVTCKVPELVEALEPVWPVGCVVEGWLCGRGAGGAALGIEAVERRLKRKRVDAALIASVSVALQCWDVRLWEGVARAKRGPGVVARRVVLERLVERVSSERVGLPQRALARSWRALMYALAGRAQVGSRGLSLRCVGPAAVFARWWWVESAPMTAKAVMLSAQLVRGRVLGEVTLGVWGEGGRLVSVGRAGVALEDEERERIVAWVREHTRQKFGPVRTVSPRLVFEMSFQSVSRSKRARSGVSLRGSRVTRWCQGQRLSAVDSLRSLHALLP